MASWTPLKRDVFDAIADEFIHNYGKGRTILAVDGAGTGQFADDLAERLGRSGHGVFRASVDRFHRPRAERHVRGDESPESFYRHSFDYDLLRRVLVEPFRLGGSTGFVTAAFDVERNVPIQMEWTTGPRDATLIIDGVFLNRPELRGLWNYSILVEAGGLLDALYIAEADPRARASAIVDNADPGHPRVFADSC